ncbi:MAG: (d)CMP kinase [Clostridia bacterium]|nr:(d)CMP kinase [Clostridia bacterium]
MKKHIAVAIDGPSGAGKSTVARHAAQELSFIYVDTGALYRSVGWYVCRAGADPGQASQVEPLLAGLDIRFGYVDGEQHVYVNGEDVGDAIRTPEMSMAASAVSALPAVRAFLLDCQRQIAAENSVIMDGRDIGTVVLPDAALKIYLTASVECRAQRRLLELQQKGIRTTYAQVEQDMRQRDYNDTHRAVAPLRRAQDAVLLDTSALDLQQSIDAVKQLIMKVMEE